MLDIKQVADKLGLTSSGIRKLVASGDIVYFQSGKKGRIRFREEWVEEFIEKNTHRKCNLVKPNRQAKKKPFRSAEGSSNRHGFNWDLLN